MKTLALLFEKSLLMLLLAALGLGAWPVTVAYAAGPFTDPQPGQGRDYLTRLQRIFEFQQERFDHQTQLLERVPARIERMQVLVDRATDKGLDASAVQAALDDFAAAVPAAQAAHDQAGALIATHAGFDEKGKITNLSAALDTVRGIHQANMSFREALLPPYRALRQAIRTFVQANNLREILSPKPTP